MDIKREALPDHAIGGEQWVNIHQVPTHDMALAVSEAVIENMGTKTTLRAETVIVQQLVEDWHVFNPDGTPCDFDGGAGVGSASQAIVHRVFKLCEPIAQRIVNPEEEETPPNREARRRAR